METVEQLLLRYCPKGGPPKVTGVDVIRVRNGRIAALYTFLDVPASGPG